MPERCLIVGLGNIGLGYDLSPQLSNVVYTHARAFSIHPAFELVGAVDPSDERRVLFECHYDKPAYADIENAIKSEKPDIVVIAAPTLQHGALVKEILGHTRPRVILCEKPLAHSLSEGREMMESCERNGVKLFVNYVRLSDPGVIEIKNRIQGGQIESPIKAVVWYSKGFFHNGSHFLNLLEFWLGSVVREEVIDLGRQWGDHDMEPDLYICFDHGKAAFLAAWEESYSHYTLELLSPSGRLSYEQGGQHITWQTKQADPSFPGYNILKSELEIIPSGMDRYQLHVVNQLALALAGKPAFLCTGNQALATLETVLSITDRRTP